MGLQFYNINKATLTKPVSTVKNITKRTPKQSKKPSQRKNKLSKNNLAFLRSITTV